MAFPLRHLLAARIRASFVTHRNRLSHSLRYLVLATTVLALPLLACTSGVAPARAEPHAVDWPTTQADWERRMVDHGHEIGRFMLSEKAENLLLAAQYYDGARVFRQIAEYTGETQPWLEYADAASAVYRRYLVNNDYGAGGWMRFPHGLYIEWDSGDRPASRDDLLQLRDRAAFSDPGTNPWADQWHEQRFSREVAYAIENQVLAERAGGPPQPERLSLYVDMALSHVRAWTRGEHGGAAAEWRFCQPFMAGLTATALIAWYEHSVATGRADDRIPPALTELADWLWDNAWVSRAEDTGYGAFRYVTPAVSGVGDETPAPDLNLLIAPMYGWLYRHTGRALYRERGDAIFAGGVALANLSDGKRFNQNYRDSFAYIEWRRQGLATADQQGTM